MSNAVTSSRPSAATQSDSRGLKKHLDVAASVSMVVASAFVITLAWLTYHHNASASGGKPTVPLPTEPVSFAGATLRGSESSPAVLIIFSDFQCPYCRAFAQRTFPSLVQSYVDTGKLAIAFWTYPLKAHPLAVPAATLALCAGEQGNFWRAHDQLFDTPQLNESVLQQVQASVGLSDPAFAHCKGGGDVQAAIEHGVSLGKQLGFNGTPGFFIGRRVSAASALIKQRLVGAQPLSVFQEAIDGVLGSKATK